VNTGMSADAPKRHRNTWRWATAVLGLVAVALLVWALVLNSDLNSTQEDLDGAQKALTAQKAVDTPTPTPAPTEEPTALPTETPTPTAEEDQGGGRAGLVAAGALITGLARELGATQEDAAATEQELADTQKQADKAQDDAAAAKQKADDATDDAEKASAQVDEANAERDAAQAKAKIAADCGKAYLSAFGGLFGSGNVSEQAPAVRKDLEGITAQCKTAFAGT
jgi:type IV secretory pathway VirB10-like protein